VAKLSVPRQTDARLDLVAHLDENQLDATKAVTSSN